MKERLKRAWFEFKIFMWYLATEPWRQIKDIVVWINKIVTSLNQGLFWMYTVLFFIIIALFTGRKPLAGVLLFVLLGIILLWDFKSGTYKHRYRQHIRNKIRKKMEEEKNGFTNNN